MKLSHRHRADVLSHGGRGAAGVCRQVVWDVLQGSAAMAARVCVRNVREAWAAVLLNALAATAMRAAMVERVLRKEEEGHSANAECNIAERLIHCWMRRWRAVRNQKATQLVAASADASDTVHGASDTVPGCVDYTSVTLTRNLIGFSLGTLVWEL